MPPSQLLDLRHYGQSVWYDYFSRHLLASGELLRMITRDGLAGLTSNPTILEQAINKSDAYDEEIGILARRGLPAEAIYERLVVEDLAEAADVLHGVYDATDGADGYVSVEVSPALARDTDGTVAEGLRLWKLLGRDNVMIKVPGTPEGFPAIRRLIAEGVNVNVTLLFSLAQYEETVRAYIAGLQDRLTRRLDIRKIASVASVFVSRIDTAIDKALDRLVLAARDTETKNRLDALKGRAAIANAKLVYRRFGELFGGPEFQRLAEAGARRQRPLWASTGTKNPKYSDVMYIEGLVGPDTVNTMPPGALKAFRDHGQARPTIEEDRPAAEALVADLARVGLDIPAIYESLKQEGLAAFEDSFTALMLGVDTKRKAALLRGAWQVAGAGLGEALDAHNAEFQMTGYVKGLWSKQAGIWSDDPAEQKKIANRLGWLESPELMSKNLPRLLRLAAEARREGLTHVLLLGMGGSSLAPEVMRAILGPDAKGSLALTVLDSTDPAAIAAVADRLPLGRALVIVASKSGTTIEPNTLSAYFQSRLQAAGVTPPARHLVAITDEGTTLHELAQRDRYREVFVNPADIGGRYSALSYFGMVPAALMGLDLSGLLAWGRGMALLSGPTSAISQNPGVALGIVMGAAARSGRDKLTLVTGPRLRPFGLWIEQLIAESTGKQGTGIVPIVVEPLGPASVYGHDRLFVRLRLHGGDPEEHDRDGKMERLRAAGFPIVTINLKEPAAIGAEFVRWEIATATAGALLDINPFDEPNVQQAKDATRALLARYAADGKLPAPAPQVTGDGIALSVDAASWQKIGTGTPEAGTDRPPQAPKAMAAMSNPGAVLGRFLGLVQPGDYVGLLAYLPFDAALAEPLAAARSTIRDRMRVATTLGYGPRYLHSTGQLHKGGPNSGVFLILTADAAKDVPIPGESYSFGTLELAQALGDFASLEATGRRVARLHLPAATATAVSNACALIRAALPAAW
jgi:transaldolase / glucose-6-phosphate isomerase